MAAETDIHQRARELLAAGRFGDIVVLLAPWAEAHTDDLQAWKLLTRAYSELHDWEHARIAAFEVLRLRPNSAPAWCTYGTILRRLDRRTEARRAQRRALQVDPGYERARLELARLREGAAAVEASPAPPPVFPEVKSQTGAEELSRCSRCRRKVPGVVLAENEGLCGSCLRAELTPKVASAAGVSPRLPRLAVIAASFIALAVVTTSLVVRGRRSGNIAQPGPATQTAAALKDLHSKDSGETPSASMETATRSLVTGLPSGRRATPEEPVFPLTQPAQATSLPRSPALPSAPPLTPSPQNAPLPSSLPFTELPSSQERPLVVMTNASPQTIGMIFSGPCHRQVAIPPYETVTLDLPIGEYHLAQWSETIPVRYGIGIFRRYKRYEATWVIVTRPAWMPTKPLTMGDADYLY